jgi:hypothetical protein
MLQQLESERERMEISMERTASIFTAEYWVR